jgi:hypothetical protein
MGSGPLIADNVSLADAPLVIAAPDLLEALTDIMRVIEIDNLIPESVSYMQAARAALAKAVQQ